MSNDRPLVTVVMPALDAGAFIGEAARSILEQRGPALELWVVDDGSVDDTVEVVEGLGDPRVRLVRNERHLGLVETLNEAYASVTTPYVARMDSDDVSLPGRLAKQVRFLEEHSEVDVVGAWSDSFERVPDGVEGVGEERTRWTLRPPTTHAALCWQVLLGVPFAHPTMLARREALLAMGPLDPSFRHAEDFEFWCRATDRLTLANVPEVLLKGRIHPGQVSSRHSEEQHRNTARALRQLLERRFALNVSQEVAAAIADPLAVARLQDLLRARRLLMSLVQRAMRDTELNESERVEVSRLIRFRARRLLKAAFHQGVQPFRFRGSGA